MNVWRKRRGVTFQSGAYTSLQLFPGKRFQGSRPWLNTILSPFCCNASGSFVLVVKRPGGVLDKMNQK